MVTTRSAATGPKHRWTTEFFIRIEDLADVVSLNDMGWVGAPVTISSFDGFACAVYIEEGQFPLLVARSSNARLSDIVAAVADVDDNDLELLDPVLQLSSRTGPISVFHHMARFIQTTGEGTLLFMIG